MRLTVDVCEPSTYYRPTREYTDAQFQRALKDAGVDGVLIVRMTEYYEDEYYVPPS